MQRERPSLRGARAPAALVGLAAGAVFWRTAYPTITWWDSSSYSLAAATLGINSPPGSLLLTLIGWPVAHLPVGDSPAYTLNLFAGLLAGIVVALVYAIATTMLRVTNTDPHMSLAASLGVAAGALTLAFSGTLWAYAIMFTPYVLSAVFTALILWAMLRWWIDADEPNAWRWLALLGLLFGLDFSVHRTNALLIPGAIVWILVRRASTLRSRRPIVAAGAGLAAGLAVHFLLIPIAIFTHSTLNFTDPSNLSRFWDYVTIKQLGGSFLLQLFPRKSPIWSVQTADVLHVLGRNFLRWSGPGGVFGVLPAMAAVWGMAMLWRRDRRLAAAFACTLALQAALTVLYFNIPANFFREFDRHYLPVCVTIGVLVAVGLGAAARQAVGSRSASAVAIAAVALAIWPASQLWSNWSANDASRRYFARDYAANALLGLPPNAIYFTVGDNDTFPVMYVQSEEGVRPDVTIINLSVANIPRWPDQLTARDGAFPLSMSLDQRAQLAKGSWADTSVALRVEGPPERFGLAPGSSMLDSITLNVRPSYGKHMLPAEVVLLDIVRTNAWRRPLAFAITGGQSAMEWLTPYGRMEGLYFRIVPQRNPLADLSSLRARLFDLARLRGYADSSIRLDEWSRRMALQWYAPLMTLLSADASSGALDACKADRAKLLARLPLDRLAAPPEYRDQIDSACGTTPKY